MAKKQLQSDQSILQIILEYMLPVLSYFRVYSARNLINRSFSNSYYNHPQTTLFPDSFKMSQLGDPQAILRMSILMS